MSVSVAQSKGARKVQARNKILSITRKMIPYVKELRQLKEVNSVTACILMQQLDYWFERYPTGFWKFQAPCEHTAYKPGNSWTEELAITVDEFRGAFKQIGVSYNSKKEYDMAADKFQGKYYCRYFNKVNRMTYYFRNHQIVDADLNGLVFTDLNDSTPDDLENPIPSGGHRQSVVVGQMQPDYKETNQDTRSHLKNML
jgi:hypothetical protein